MVWRPCAPVLGAECKALLKWGPWRLTGRGSQLSTACAQHLPCGGLFVLGQIERINAPESAPLPFLLRGQLVATQYNMFLLWGCK